MVQSTPVHAATSLPPSIDLVTAHDLNTQPEFAHALPAVHDTVIEPAKGVGYVKITLDGAVAAVKEGDETFRLFPGGHVHASTME